MSRSFNKINEEGFHCTMRCIYDEINSNRTFFISSRLLNLNVALTVVFLHVALLHFYTYSEWDDISSHDVLKIKIGRTFGEDGQRSTCKSTENEN